MKAAKVPRSAGEQNAPRVRAVVGGLLVATLSTLLSVPVVYSTLRVKAPKALEASDSGGIGIAGGRRGKTG